MGERSQTRAGNRETSVKCSLLNAGNVAQHFNGGMAEMFAVYLKTDEISKFSKERTISFV